MKRYLLPILLSFSLVGIGIQDGFGQQQKLAQTGMKFLSVSLDARATAVGDAVTALESNSSAMFYNPAGMARLPVFADLTLGQVNWLADFKHSFASLSLKPWNGKYGVLGFMAHAVDYGDFIGTIRSSNDLGYVEVGNFTPNALAVGIGYANALSDKFSVGGNVKYAQQSLGSAITGISAENQYTRQDNKVEVAAFDFGILYHTGYKSLNFGMNVRNFSKEIKYLQEGFQLPLVFNVGLSMNILDLYPRLSSSHALLLAVDAVHPRDYPEQINIGGEYVFMKTLAVRAGYSSPNDEHGLSAGLGLQSTLRNHSLNIDYAYTPYTLFDDVHRFSLHFGF